MRRRNRRARQWRLLHLLDRPAGEAVEAATQESGCTVGTKLRPSGAPLAGNFNFDGLQHFIPHLMLTKLRGSMLVNGSMSSDRRGEDEIRKTTLEADLLDPTVALSGQPLSSTQSLVCLRLHRP